MDYSWQCIRIRVGLTIKFSWLKYLCLSLRTHYNNIIVRLPRSKFSVCVTMIRKKNTFYLSDAKKLSQCFLASRKMDWLKGKRWKIGENKNRQKFEHNPSYIGRTWQIMLKFLPIFLFFYLLFFYLFFLLFNPFFCSMHPLFSNML